MRLETRIAAPRSGRRSARSLRPEPERDQRTHTRVPQPQTGPNGDAESDLEEERVAHAPVRALIPFRIPVSWRLRIRASVRAIHPPQSRNQPVPTVT